MGNMNLDQAKMYGKKIGCKYYVYNSNGGLLGGFKSFDDAEECKQEWEDDYKTDKLNRNMKVYIREE